MRGSPRHACVVLSVSVGKWVVALYIDVEKVTERISNTRENRPIRLNACMVRSFIVASLCDWDYGDYYLPKEVRPTSSSAICLFVRRITQIYTTDFHKILYRVPFYSLTVYWRPSLLLLSSFVQKVQTLKNEKALRGDANTASWLQYKAEPKNFAPPQTSFPGARDSQNLISWRWSLSLPYKPSLIGSMHAISSYRGNRPTNKHTHTPTGPITIHCAAV